MFEVSGTIFGKRGVSLPFTDHCSPLVTKLDDFEILLRNIINNGKEWGWGRIYFKGNRLVKSGTPCTATYNLHTLTLKSDDKALLKSFRSSTRRNITKAKQKHITIEIATNLNALKDFYHLNCITRRHHGVPPQPFHFFQRIHEHILSKGAGYDCLGTS